jgi:hypothetical protein
MTSKITKSTIVKRINEVEILDSKLLYVNRTCSTSRKQSDFRKFIQEVEEMIKEERDVLLIAIKCK